VAAPFSILEPESRTAMPQPLNVALIGYGFAGKTFHAPLLTAIPGLSLAVVASSQPEKVHADLPGVRVVAGPEDAIRDPEIDLVVIASPNQTHEPLALAALEAGKHVVVDKPFTITLDEARRVVSAAQRHGRLVSVFQNRRWDSEFLAAQAVLASGRLGDVVSCDVHFDRFRPQVRDRWREQPQPGGGIWYDLGPHLADQALCLFGLPRSVTARLAMQRHGAQATDWAHVMLDYGRLQVSLHASVLVASGSPRFRIHGTAGSWIKAATDPQEAQLLAGMRPGAEGWGRDPQPDSLHGEIPGQTAFAPGPGGDYRRYYEGVRDAILGAAAHPVTGAQAIAVMAVLETAIRSASLGRTLPLPLTPEELAAYSLDLPGLLGS
jgi:predicted dehydrogenase